MVKFISSRALRNTPSAVWEALEANDAVAIVSNGEPRALMLELEGGDLDETMQLVRRVRAQMALSRLRTAAARAGLDALTPDDVDAEIAAARADANSAAGAASPAGASSGRRAPRGRPVAQKTATSRRQQK